MRFIGFSAAAVLASMAVATAAHAQLVVDKLWLDLSPGKTARGDILVRNESKDRYYVSISTVRIDNPGAPDQVRTSESDPEKLGLLTTPNRMILDPGTQRSVRIVVLGDAGNTDRVYRVLISPAIGDLTTTGTAADSRGLAIKVLTAYEALIVVRPNGGVAKIEGERKDGELKLRNTGNTSALLYDFSACKPLPLSELAADAKPAPASLPPTPAAGDQAKSDPGAKLETDKVNDKTKQVKCDRIGAVRLYAGNSTTIPLVKPNEPVTLEQKTFVSDDPVPLKF